MSKYIKDQAQGLRQSLNAKISTSHYPLVLGVASGKGGVGKSNVSVNLAWQFARLGKKVLLFDADFGLGNTDLLLGISPKYTMADVLFGDKNISEIACQINPNLSLLAAGSANYSMSNASSMLLDSLFYQLESFAEQYDIVIVDTGAGIGEQVISPLLYCDQLIVVTSPDPASLTDSYATIKMVKQRDQASEFGIVVNMIENLVQGKRVYQQLAQVCSQYLGIIPKALGYIPMDSRVKTAVRKQHIVSELFPSSAASMAFALMAQEFVQKTSVEHSYKLSQFVQHFFKPKTNHQRMALMRS